MIEIPESYVLAKQVNENLAGKVIKFAQANHSHHKFAWYYGDSSQYGDLLIGKTISDARACGGFLEISAGDTKIVFGDGANLRYFEDLSKVPENHQLYLEFEDETACAVTISMYACIFVSQGTDIDNEYFQLAKAKVNPLSDEFDFDYFLILRDENSGKLSAKAFLATKQRIPGLGNGVLQDILYQAQIFPKRKMSTISDEEYERLFHTVKDVLAEMTEKGGRDTEKDLFGNPGGYITYLSKKTLHTPCPKCGYEIHKEAYLGGVIYYCEKCQPDLK